MRAPLCLSASFFALSACTTLTSGTAVAPGPTFEAKNRAQTVEQVSDPYFRRADTAVRSRLADDFIPQAKNVILFVGNGMGISTITAARIYAGQKRGADGESYLLHMEKLPHSALSRTYSHDHQVTDGAAAATAMLSGVKTRSGVIGVRSGIVPGDCASQAAQGTESLFEMAERRDLATGIISTARVTDATLASAYAESADPASCTDMARQLIDWPRGDGFEIVLGGGREHFLTDETPDPEHDDRAGQRGDGKDLIAAWAAKSDAHQVVFDGDGFDALDFTSDARVLGLFEPSDMQYERDRAQAPGNEPSIAEMTEAAITRLSQDGDGFVLMIEGGRFDHARHAADTAYVLEDIDAFDMAVARAVEMTDPSETLIIVTANHSETAPGTVAPRRNAPILDHAADAAVSDVAIFASGPGAELVRGVMDQNEIFHVMGYASGLLAIPRPASTE
ncbi:MAG: alkaline phosphatase [Henriciella sp.]|nr:alkaline phosphatase [Henriciella sp.]